MIRRPVALATLFSLSAIPALTHAQVTVKPDGVFRSLLGVSASVTSGNTRSSTLTLSGEGVQQTDYSKWGLTARALYARSEGNTTAANGALGTQYDRDFLNREWFGFGKFDYLRDKPANLESRTSYYGGVGKHLIRSDEHTWDVFGGLGYTEDRYETPTEVADELRSRYGRTEAVLSEASTHKLTENTSFRQKLEVYPNLRTKGEYRTVIDTSVSVAMTARLSLNTGLIHRYNSDPGNGLKHGDSLFVTGVSLRFD